MTMQTDRAPAPQDAPPVSPQAAYLAELEEACRLEPLEDHYLWPRSEIGHDMQDKRRRLFGITDYDVQRRRSRPAQLIRALRRLITQGCIPAAFSIADVACGDGVILWQIRRAWPEAQCYGIDCLKDRIGVHAQVQAAGVALRRIFIQRLFAQAPPRAFDVVMMLNTYRGWDAADLRPHERDLPARADAWFAQSARYLFVNATPPQAAAFRRRGLSVQRIGGGDQGSLTVCVSSETLPRSPWWSSWGLVR